VVGYRASVLETAGIVAVGTGTVADNQHRRIGTLPAAVVVGGSMQRCQGSGHVRVQVHSGTGC